MAKPPLSRDELRDIIDLSLWVGQLLLQHGADSERVEETVHRFGTALGCDWIDVLVSPNVIAITSTSGEEFRTKIRRVVNIGVNMHRISAINRLSRRVVAGELDRFQVRSEIERINNTPPQYNRWVVVGMVGLACAAFSQLFGGDGPVFAVTLVASSVAMWVRQELTRRYFNPLLVVIATAFVAGVIASLAVRFNLGEQPQLALAASVLLLVPGVPLINSAEDLFKGHSVIGMTRGLVGGLITLAIALGLSLALQLMGVNTL
ncbi:MAG: threonine/serine exporter family protein [Anaerolineaceae bacterium]|nr:threonine/serine exporter family protein [Anaerolineaceae bacterium]